MGSTASKAAKSAPRRYPSGVRAPPSSIRQTPAATSSSARQTPRPSSIKDDAIRADSVDPDVVDAAFAKRLQQMGVVQPSPTLSHSSTAASPGGLPHASWPRQAAAAAQKNTTVSALEARRRLQEQADAEFDRGFSRRELLDVATIRAVLARRSRGSAAADIEKSLGLRPGVVARLGPEGYVGTLDDASAAP